MAELFGGKKIYGLGVLMTAVFTLLSPIAARINFPLFIAVRVLEGMGEVSYFVLNGLSVILSPIFRRA